MEKKYKVLKRDESIEKFDIEKIRRVVMAAGLNKDQAEQLKKNIDTWLISQKKDIIPSKKIRDEVYKELKKIKSYSANLFLWYEKSKEKKD